LRIAVCAANSVVGRGDIGIDPTEACGSSHTEGVDGRAGVVDGAGVDTLPGCVDDRECVPGNGSVGSTDTGRRMTFLKEARKLLLSFSRITLPCIDLSKSSASSPIFN
jgi:hypothetical protein